MIRQPITLPPYYVSEPAFYDLNGDKVYGVQIRSSNPESSYPVLTEVFSDEDPFEADMQNTVKDALFINEACNHYSVLVNFLERLEATTTDKETAEKIKKQLVEMNIWSETLEIPKTEPIEN